jgi:predicted DNA-binding antitoxin AbrB/MazE fold protein
MASEILEAVFEHGAFRLLQTPSLPLRDGQQVRIMVETPESPEAILALAASVYEGLSADDIAEVERIALKREDFFGRTP